MALRDQIVWIGSAARAASWWSSGGRRRKPGRRDRKAVDEGQSYPHSIEWTTMKRRWRPTHVAFGEATVGVEDGPDRPAVTATVPNTGH